MDSLLRRAALACATLAFASFASPLTAQQSLADSSRQSVAPAPPPDLQGAAAATTAEPRHRWVNTGGYLTPAPRRAAVARSAPKHQAKAVRVRSNKARAVSKADKSATKSLSKAELNRCERLSTRQLRHNSKCQTALREKQTPSKRQTMKVKTLTKAELRHCRSLTSRQLRRNAVCQTALRPAPKPNRAAEKPVKALSRAELRRCQSMSYRQLLRNGDCAAQLQRDIQADAHSKHEPAKKAAAQRKKAVSSKNRRARQSTKRHRR